MPQATNTTTTSRRALLGCSGASLIAMSGAHRTIVQPDANLIRLCGEFDALERCHQGAWDEGPQTVEEDRRRAIRLTPIVAQQEALLGRICGLRATTLGGFVKRASSLVLYDECALAGEDDECWGQRMRFALVRDLLLAGQIGSVAGG